MRFQSVLRASWVMTMIAVSMLFTTAKSNASTGLQIQYSQSDLFRPVAITAGTGSYDAGAFDTKLFNSVWDDTFHSYCVDLGTDVTFGEKSDVVAEYIDATNKQYGAAAWLVTNYDRPDLTANEACGLQLAIWNTIYGTENKIDSATNSFNLLLAQDKDANDITPDITKIANGYLGSLPAPGEGAAYAALLHTPTNQLMIANGAYVNPPAVPELSTVTLFGSMLAGMGPLVIRKRRK